MQRSTSSTGTLAIATMFLATVLHILWLGAAHAQSPMPEVDLPKVNQIDLTEKSAHNAMLAFRDFKKKYANAAPPDSDAKAYVRAMLASADMQATAKSYGFTDTNHWYQTLFSFVMAYSIATEGDYEKMKRSMAGIQNNPDLPEELKTRLAASLGALLPPERNVELAKSMAANPDYSPLIAEIKE